MLLAEMVPGNVAGAGAAAAAFAAAVVACVCVVPEQLQCGRTFTIGGAPQRRSVSCA